MRKSAVVSACLRGLKKTTINGAKVIAIVHSLQLQMQANIRHVRQQDVTDHISFYFTTFTQHEVTLDVNIVYFVL
jgi:hypothetical protein